MALVGGAMAGSPLGPYQLQAAIAALHVQAPRAEDTAARRTTSLPEQRYLLGRAAELAELM
ncbi:hypothetical protein Nocox_22990 [Nonomuraea coxensis DSM 45129]|uniref:Uncharacterized protein n=1 Tax=Nonomuraea coxensis DSM 45129 TaxID=1122611 RepID=A0ABX8U380_9ACTN|nr:hypothetical protein Nocox_22990 [Nonomuraea coxensis DSM 45129]